MTLVRTHMRPLPVAGAAHDESGEHQTLAALQRKLDEGWQIEPPVYVMADPAHRSRIVFRMVLWREGKPRVASVRDCPEIRQYLADRRLRQEAL